MCAVDARSPTPKFWYQKIEHSLCVRLCVTVDGMFSVYDTISSIKGWKKVLMVVFSVKSIEKGLEKDGTLKYMTHRQIHNVYRCKICIFIRKIRGEVYWSATGNPRYNGRNSYVHYFHIPFLLPRVNQLIDGPCQSLPCTPSL